VKKILNIHPGEILEEEFLKEFHISAYRLAKETKMPPTRISEIINGLRSAGGLSPAQADHKGSALPFSKS